MNDNLCESGPKLIFPCSGAADVGGIADQAGRVLSREGTGKMFCLAGVGGRVNGIVKSTHEASKILAIDGCPLDCARLTLEAAGFFDIEHIVVTDLGLEKGNSPITEESIAVVVEEARRRLED